MKNAWLSVLIPTYNGQDYLPQALDSVISQKDDQIECIAVDDGSTDSTLSILGSYSRKLSLTIIRRPENCGWAANVNRALAAANAEHCCILHQDDLWTKERLCMLKKILREHPDANMILHPSWFVDGKGRRMGSWRCPLPSYPNRIAPDLILERLLVQNFISIPAPLFKRETALKMGGLDEKLWYTSDWDFWLKMASCGKILYYPQPLSAFRIHAGSQTSLRSANLSAFREQQETVLDRNMENLKAPAGLKERVRKTAAFSNEMNIAIASVVHKKNIAFFRLLRLFFALGPPGWHSYFRDSRIFERVPARFRAGLLWDDGK